jgi:diguanylate cyclase (GGDEF)-like protein
MLINMGILNDKKRFSLAFKFNTLSIALILVTAVGICLYTVRLEMANYYQELLNHGITIAETASHNCEYGIYTEDRDALQRALQGLSKDADIAYVAVLNAGGRILASITFQTSAEIAEAQHEGEALGGQVSHRDHAGRDGGRYLEVLFPIAASNGGILDPLVQSSERSDQKVLGYLRLGLTQEGLRRKIRDLVFSTVLFTSVLVILGSVLSFYLSRRITHPIQRLKAAAEEITKGNFETPIEIRTTDEIADLARSFEYMRGRVRDSSDQLQHDAIHDVLTGLPNRALFSDRLRHAIILAKRRAGFYFGVLFIDLDDFKVINDSLGHTVGDLLLVAFSKKLVACVRPLDTVARLGGDEFAVLLEDISGESNAMFVASRIKEALKKPFPVAGREVFITGSMGIALSSSGYETPEQVLRDADTAMYQSKTHRRADFTIFEPAMHARAVERLRLETDLRRAIERQEFVPYYQAILSVKEKCIIGYEALARWQHPERGLIPPGNFIPMAEETGMIVAIDRLILRQACVQMKKWLDRFRGDHLNFVSVNLAHKQIMQPDLVEHVALVLEETGLPPEHLKLEITENVLFENPESALTLLSRLRGLGVQLYIDDFGTGYSSLSYLHRLPINGLKIDRSFVKRIDDVGENHAIIRTIMTLARDLNIDAVAEGVETTSQLAHIASLDCAYWQGFLFSKPVKSEEAQALIAG